MKLEASIIIPTYNRIDKLLRCLNALENQSVNRNCFEIIVVDDGSTDDTEKSLQPFIAAQKIRYFRQENGGPARARNKGVREATGNIIAFIGDDIIPTSGWLEAHLNEHAHWNNDPHLAVVGLTEWSDQITPTPLMITPGLGTNFEYHAIDRGMVNPQDLPHRFFYTSNISLWRSFFTEKGSWFDEDFRFAMGEDGELAYRMKKQGLKVVYRADALTYHEHLLNFDHLCRRYRLMGQEAILQAKKHPELAELSFLNVRWHQKVRNAARDLLARLLMPWLRWIDRQRWSIPEKQWLYKTYAFVFEVWKYRGLLDGLVRYQVSLRA
jgi:glycosyltransferase involved in cell wall biosynthesis